MRQQRNIMPEGAATHGGSRIDDDDIVFRGCSAVDLVLVAPVHFRYLTRAVRVGLADCGLPRVRGEPLV